VIEFVRHTEDVVEFPYGLEVSEDEEAGGFEGVMEYWKGVRYVVEWEVDMLERPNGHHPGYLANEIVPVS